MKETITGSETTSRNAFEKYLKLIETIRISSTKEAERASLNHLETTVLLLERLLQDLDDKTMKKDQIDSLNEKTLTLLEEFYDLFEVLPNDAVLVDAICYNLMACITIIKNITPKNFQISIRQLYKLYLAKKARNAVHNIKMSILRHRMVMGEKKHDLASTWAHYEALVGAVGTNEIENYIGKSILDNIQERLLEDYFQFGDFSFYKTLSIDELNRKLSKFDLHEPLERLFYLEEGDSHFEWEMKFVISAENEIYSAKDISYLLYTFSSALEGIGDIEVELEDWGTGSRWAKLKIKIKDGASKLDVLDVLNKLRQQTEGLIHGKTYGEVKKEEGNSKLVEARAEKVKKQAESMPNPDVVSQLKEIDLNLDVQKKALEVESAKEDIRAKKIQNLKTISELLRDGIITNDGHLQLYINDCLYIDTTKLGGSAELKSLDEIEAKEEKIKEDDSSESGS